MHKRLLTGFCFVTLLFTGLWAAQSESPTLTQGEPQSASQPSLQTAAQAVTEAAPSEVFVPEVEFGGELVATLQAFVYCKNIGGACTSNSQCGNLGTCVNNICECECNYGAYCNPANPNCGYAGFCNAFNHRCACY